MKTKALWNLAGVLSVVWMGGGYFFMRYLPHNPKAGLLRFFIFVIVIWWGLGSMLAVGGLRHGAIASRVCAALSIVLLLIYIWLMFFLPPAK
jgi:hypothetical protein